MQKSKKGYAGIWYRTEKSSIRKWKDYEDAFISQFIGYKDDEDWMDELKAKKQGKNEKISPFITSFRFIASNMRKQKKEQKLVKIAITNLRLEYHSYMACYRQRGEIATFRKLKELGQKFELEKEQISKSNKERVAAIEETKPIQKVEINQQNKENNNKNKKNKTKVAAITSVNDIKQSQKPGTIEKPTSA